jgi:hypothetical protein
MFNRKLYKYKNTNKNMSFEDEVKKAIEILKKKGIVEASLGDVQSVAVLYLGKRSLIYSHNFKQWFKFFVKAVEQQGLGYYDQIRQVLVLK